MGSAASIAGQWSGSLIGHQASEMWVHGQREAINRFLSLLSCSSRLTPLVAHDARDRVVVTGSSCQLRVTGVWTDSAVAE